MELNFDIIYWIPVMAMKLTLTHPEMSRNIKWLIKFTIAHGIFTFAFTMVIYSIFRHDLKVKDFTKICQNGAFALVYVAVTINYFILLWKQDSLNNLINRVKEDYVTSKTYTIKDKGIVCDYAKKSAVIGNLVLVLIISGVLVFPLKNILLYIYNYWIDEFRLLHLHYFTYPPFIQERRDDLWVYAALYIMSMHYAIYSGLIYVAFIPLGPMFLLHACGRLELLTNRVNALYVKPNKEEVMDELKQIVKESQRIYSFVDCAKEAFQMSYEVTFKCITITLPVTIYECIESFRSGKVSLEFLAFMIAGILFPSIPCYYGDLLVEKGEQFRMAVYCCGWECRSQQRERTTLQLILQRAQKPVAIQTLFRTISLDTLTDIYHQSYAIFSLMNAMWH